MNTRVFVDELPDDQRGNHDHEFSVSLRVALSDASKLWSAAAERLLRSAGLEMDDVIDTIGPSDDPSLADCLAILVSPETMAGCALRYFAIGESVPQGKAQCTAARLAA